MKEWENNSNSMEQLEFNFNAELRKELTSATIVSDPGTKVYVDGTRVIYVHPSGTYVVEPIHHG